MDIRDKNLPTACKQLILVTAGMLWTIFQILHVLLILLTETNCLIVAH